MQLEAEDPSIQITEPAFEELMDTLLPYTDNIFDDLNNVTDDTYNEAMRNFDEDEWKIAIDAILHEMRLNSPIEDFFFEEFCANYIFQTGNNDLNGTVDGHDHNFNENLALQEHNAEPIISEGNQLDSFSDGSWSIPDVEMELDDEVQFKYDVTDQLNGERDIKLPIAEPDSTTLTIEDGSGSDVDFQIVNNNNTTLVMTGTSGLNVDFEIIDNNDRNIEVNEVNEPDTVSDNLLFPCSTNLPMTTEELQEDIQKYLNTEQDFSYASFDEYEDLINGTCDAQHHNTNNVNNNNVLLQEYIDEQNQLMQTLDPINPDHFFEKPYSPLFVRKRSHALGRRIRCTVCNFATTKPFELRHHKACYHRNAYCCQICGFITYSKPEIRLHLMFNH